MRTLLLMLIVVARAAVAGPSGACPQMSPSNVAISFVGTNCFFNSPMCLPLETIQFHATTFGYNFSCAAHTFLWDFGDGTTAQTQSPAHVYVTYGIYNVSVSIANSQQQLTLTRSLMILPIGDPPPPIEVHGLYDLGRPVPRGYLFTIGGAVGAGDWIWDFGDGTIVRGPERQQTHIFPHGGTFIVTLTSALSSSSYATEVYVPIERRRSARH